MAELILSPIVGEIVQQLRSEAVKLIALIWGVKEELGELEDTISTIRAVLIDAEEKQSHNNQVRLWLERLGDSVLDADDLIDDFNTEAMKRQLMPRKSITKQVRTFFSSSNQLVFRYKTGSRIREIKENLAKINSDRTFHLEERNEESVVVAVRRERETHSFLHQENVVGRDSDRNEIIRLLLDENQESIDECVSIVSIVGMGGLGKTTLAQSVFNNEKIQKHFELKIWVCVSDNFEVQLIVQQVIDSATNTKSSGHVGSFDKLQKDLRDLISEKRYVLVLDDVWEENQEKWLKLSDLLVCRAKGSRVVVTTRSHVVAEITSKSGFIYRLGGLDDESSWSLFKKTTLLNEEPENPNLIGIARDIVRKCGGIPLAIRTVGSLLYTRKLGLEAWSSFNKEFSDIICQQQGNNIMPTLKLSYDHLPSNLKSCFAFCKLFPKDSKINVQGLVQLWMAQGFLKLPYLSDQSLEDVGYGCFVDLYERSFFQEAELDEGGVVESCKMHDLMHDLAIKVAGLQYENVDLRYQGAVNKSTRHVSIDLCVSSAEYVSTLLLNATNLRTMLSLKFDSGMSHETICVITSFKLLRALKLECAVEGMAPDSIGKLKHLRYLDLSWSSHITTLPDSITNLLNLQTLKLNFCFSLKELPRDFKRLVNLRHLEIDSCSKLTHMPQGISRLTNLQTLSTYVLPERDRPIPRESGELKELASLNNLRGALTIKNIRQCEIEAAVFNEKQHLQSLSLFWDSAVSVPVSNSVALESLQQLTNLVNLELTFVKSCKLLIPVSQLHGLKKLSLYGMGCLESIDEANNNTNRLDMSEPIFQRLVHLRIRGCPKLTSMPLFPHVEDLCLDNTSMKPFEQTAALESTSSLSPLSKLKKLYIYNTKENMQYLPDSFKRLTSLEYLNIQEPHLTDLSPGLQYITNLQSLKIRKCNELKSIPECIANLTSLENLSIDCCPIVLKRCDKHTGEDWPKISHIPHLDLLSEYDIPMKILMKLKLSEQ